MRKFNALMFAWMAILVLVAGCNGTEQRNGESEKTKVKPGSSPEKPATAPQTAAKQGRVLETMDAGGYTYVNVATDGGEDWYAAPQFKVAAGDTVTVPANAMAMRDFESPTLGRTFDLVYFASAIRKVGATSAAPAVRRPEGMPKAPHGMPKAAPANVDLSGVSKAEGGMSVADVFAAGASAAGREVVLRGKVVKYNAGIMGKNWLHLRDGTGGEGTNDITVTTQDTAKVGDTVLIKGKLSADKDFGFGYKYALIIEEATVVVE